VATQLPARPTPIYRPDTGSKYPANRWDFELDLSRNELNGFEAGSLQGSAFLPYAADHGFPRRLVAAVQCQREVSGDVRIITIPSTVRRGPISPVCLKIDPQ
jgi:hypothetical protein